MTVDSTARRGSRIQGAPDAVQRLLAAGAEARHEVTVRMSKLSLHRLATWTENHP